MQIQLRLLKQNIKGSNNFMHEPYSTIAKNIQQKVSKGRLRKKLCTNHEIS